MNLTMENKKFFGNQALHRMLIGAIDGGHLCHAYLFYGQKNIGKRSCAEFFAQAILCENENRPCGECRSCKKAAADIHPDIIVSENKEGKNNIHIDTIREIRRDAYIRPNESAYKIYIIPNAHDMTAAAANALLKVLEEPPAYAVFILTAESKKSVLETIASRCVSFEVFPLTEGETLEALKQQFGENDKVKEAAELCGGVLGNAIDILQNEDYQRVSEIVSAATQAIIKRDEYALLCALNRVGASRGDLTLMLSLLSAKMNAEMKKSLSEKDGKLTQSELYRLCGLIEQIRSGNDRNINTSLLLNKAAAEIISIL